MDILFCISSLDSGGAERVLSELANRYVDKGHSVSILTLVSSEKKPFYFIDPRINLIQTNKSSNGKYSVVRRLYNVSSSLLGIRKTIQKLNPGKVITFIDLMNVRVLLACFGLNISVIVSERTDPAHHRLPMRRLSEWLRLKLYPGACRVVVQTISAANYFPKNFREKMDIIPNAVKNPEKRKASSFERIEKIITVGRLSEEKNHIELIIAFSDWLKKFPRLILKIYGEGKDRESLEKLIAERSLSGKVQLLGTVKNIQEVLLDADLFVFPSRYEGFPNALCEAMAVGLPVVASNCSGNAEVIQDGVNGKLFPVGDMQAFTKAVLELINNSIQCQALSVRSCEVVERFSQRRVYEMWDRLILNSEN